MSELDLTEAVEAAARMRHESVDRAAWGYIGEPRRAAMRAVVRPLITAAAPLIEAQVREQVAREIDRLAAGFEPCNDHWIGHIDGLRDAARIARGGAS